jgi:hypothetical protein
MSTEKVTFTVRPSKKYLHIIPQLEKLSEKKERSLSYVATRIIDLYFKKIYNKNK